MSTADTIQPAIGFEPIGVRAVSGSMLQVLTLCLEDQAFAVDAAVVREILDPVPVTAVPNARPLVARLINVRGKVVPLADLRVAFGMEPKPPTPETRIVVVEIELDGEPTIIALVADRVQEVTEIAVDDFIDAPRVGMRWRPEFIRCFGRKGDDFLVMPNLARIFV
jgi:purine-binding chemotaxis protein CheW